MKGFNRGNQSKLPLLLGFSVGVCGIIVVAIGIAALKKNSTAATAATVAAAPAETEKRVVVIQKEATVEMVDVLVPIADIEQGKKLDPAMFRLDKRPKVALGQNSVRSFDELRNQYARSIIPANSPLNKEVMTPIRPANPVIASIPAGFRAVTISVNALSSVEGWASAGAMVDIQWINSGSANIIVQNAKILSAERQVENSQQPNQGAPIPTTVTLLVTEKDAQRISLATTSGQLMLHLRGATDIGKGSNQDGPITLRDLRGGLSSDDTAEATVKIRNADGTIRELIIKDGKLQQSKKD